MIRTVTVVVGVLLSSLPAFALDKNFEIAMTRGVYAVDRGEYREAGEILARAVVLEPNNPDAVIAFAIARSRAGRYPEAERLFRRGLSLRPGDRRAGVELAAILDETGRAGEAAEIRAGITARGGDVPGSGGGMAGPGNRGEKNYALIVLTGIQYDSNTVLEPANPGYDRGKKSDWRTVAALDGEWYLRRSAALDLSLDYRFYQGFNSNNSDFDLTANTVSLKGLYRLPEQSRLKLALAYNHAMASGESYSGINSFGAAFEHSFRNNTLSFTLDREWRRFRNTDTFPANDERSGDRYELGVSHRMDFHRSIRLEFGYLFECNNADRDYWDYNGRTIRASLGYRRGAAQSFVEASYTDRGYGAADPAVARIRRDYVQQYGAGFLFPLTRVLSLAVSEDYVIYGSNIARFDYDRSVSGISLLGRF